MRSGDQEWCMVPQIGLGFYIVGDGPNCVRRVSKSPSPKATPEVTTTYDGVVSCKDSQRWGRPIRGSDQREEAPPKRSCANLRRVESATAIPPSRLPYPGLVQHPAQLQREARKYGGHFRGRRTHTWTRRGWPPRNRTRLGPRTGLTSDRCRGRGQSSHLMATDFKLGKIPGSVFVGRALDVPERGLISGNIAVDIQRDLNCAYISLNFE